MLLSDFIRRSTSMLSGIYPSLEARGIVLMLCQERLGVKSYTHIIEPGYEVTSAVLPRLEDDLRRLSAGEPIQYVLGYAEFCGRRFRVCPSVLIPRPETEQLVSEAVSFICDKGRSCRVLDLCTGSGCIAWSVFLESPGTEVVAVDISDEALGVARSQFAGASPRFVKADVLAGGEGFEYGDFDLVLCNPPYVMESEKLAMRTNVLDYEPGLALFVPDSDPLLFYRAVAVWARRFLRPDGMGLVEINESLGPQTAEVFRRAGYKKTRILQDFRSKYRFVMFGD